MAGKRQEQTRVSNLKLLCAIRFGKKHSPSNQSAESFERTALNLLSPPAGIFDNPFCAPTCKVLLCEVSANLSICQPERTQ